MSDKICSMSQFSWPTNSPKPLNISALPHYTLHQRLFVSAFAMANESLQMDHSPKHANKLAVTFSSMRKTLVKPSPLHLEFPEPVSAQSKCGRLQRWKASQTPNR